MSEIEMDDKTENIINHNDEKEFENESNGNSKSKNNIKNKNKNNNSRKRKFDDMDKIEKMNELSIKEISNEPPTKKQKKERGKKEKDKKEKEKKKKRGWSESEEELYRSGLELYGRDWNKIAKHVGNNRNAASIRSHSQVYFLKLLSEKKLLPQKVLETGNGYTLGGKPLNKYSSIAIRHFGSPQNVPIIDGVISDKEEAEKNKRPKKNKKKENNDNGNNNNNNDNNKKKRKKKKKKKNKYYDSTDDEDDDIYKKFIKNGYNENEEQIKRRKSSRNTMNKKKINNEALHIIDPYGLHTDLECYTNKHDDIQPFDIYYCPNALLIADIHSHLCRNVEIMGLLGGKYDKENKILYILKCYPIREEEQDEHTVCADSANHFEITNKIRNIDNLELIGWYHSHPNFENYPSNTDCFQHYQQKYDDEEINPYIGLIISPWNDQFDCKSNYRFFNSYKEFNHIYTPKEFNIKDTKIKLNINNKNNMNQLLKQIKTLITTYLQSKYDIYRTDFGEIWNENAQIKINRGQKVLQSVQSHLEIDHEDINNDKIKNEFIKEIEEMFLENCDIWWVTNKPNTIQSTNENDIVEKENKNSLN